MPELTGLLIGNIIIVQEDDRLLAYRQVDGDNQLIAVFVDDEQGLILSTLFAAYISILFPDGEITHEIADKRFQDNQATSD